MPICELSHVDRTYGSGNTAVHAVRDVSLTIDEGEFVVFWGPSGSGKTTLLNVVGCLDVADSGTVKVAGTDVSALSSRELAALRAKRIGFIFQSFNLIPVLTAAENVELALQLAGDAEHKRERSVEMLKRVGLGELVDRRPNQLSGGQQQRVAIARALVKRPDLVIADEPTANLDSETGHEVLELMREMNRELEVTFLFSSHDPAVIEIARRRIHLVDGAVAADERNGGEE